MIMIAWLSTIQNNNLKNMNTGHAIKTLRKRRNLSQGELCKMIKLSQPSLSLIETGIKQPSQRNLKKILMVFKVTESELAIASINENDFAPEFRKLGMDMIGTLLGMMKRITPDQRQKI